MLGPIFARELITLPRRDQHYVARTVYLGVIWVLAMTVWQVLVGWQQSATLGDIARFSLLLFQIVTYVQLPLLLFFSALSAASNITTEKDRRTIILLLMTDLRNYEIVLGKLFGSLLQILLLLSGTVPILVLLLFLGGVAGYQVIQATVVMVAAAVAAGSLGALVALWRDKTFQALALTVLFIVLYLAVVQAVPLAADLVAWAGGPQASPAAVAVWQSWLDPFAALQSVLEPFAENEGPLPPAYGFAISMLALSLLLNAASVAFLRVWNPSGEPIIQRDAPEAQQEEQERIDRARAHAAPGAVRDVRGNPILWREVMTRAYGRRPLIVKLAYFLVLALLCYYVLAPVVSGETHSPWAAANGLVPVCILSLLLVAAQATTAITSERDNGALDLLLVTDLTAPEFIFGKLGGVAYNTKEFLLPPLILTGIYAAYGYLHSPPDVGRSVVTGILVGGAIVVLEAFTMVLGVHVALRTKVSRLAIANSLGTVFFLSVGTLICIYLILINGQFEYQWASFVLFLLAGIGGLWWVLAAARPSTALTLASWACPLAVFYAVTTVLIGKPGARESADPYVPFIVVAGAFGFTVFAMLVPLLSEFDAAMGRTTGEAD